MLRPVRCLAVALALVPALLLSTSLPTAAGGRRCGGPRTAACTILRPPDPGGPVEAAELGRECIVLVGGFDSTNGDRTFDDLFLWAQDEPLYQMFRFGHDQAERYPYTTTGPIDVSADDLRGLIRTIAPGCRAVDVVTHSMGGAVADRAFSMGLSTRDGVATYVALAGPHNGATLAKALRPPIEADPLIAIETSVLARTLDQPDPTTPAAHDLARLHAPRPIRGIASVRLRVATDAMVLRRDSADRRAEVREYFALDEPDGHGGILHNDEVRRILETTIASHSVTADRRSPVERAVADRVSRWVDEHLSEAYMSVSRYLSSDASAPAALAAAYVTARVASLIAEAVGTAMAFAATDIARTAPLAVP